MKDNSEGLYCAKVKTACEFEKIGCLCLACPLAPEFSLDKLYYCEIGADE
jgi:hypothetical protein